MPEQASPFDFSHVLVQVSGFLFLGLKKYLQNFSELLVRRSDFDCIVHLVVSFPGFDLTSCAHSQVASRNFLTNLFPSFWEIYFTGFRADGLPAQ